MTSAISRAKAGCALPANSFNCPLVIAPVISRQSCQPNVERRTSKVEGRGRPTVDYRLRLRRRQRQPDRDPHTQWLGRKDSNLRIRDPKSRALPLGHAPSSHRPSRHRNHAGSPRSLPDPDPRFPAQTRYFIRCTYRRQACCARSRRTALRVSPPGTNRAGRLATPDTGVDRDSRSPRVFIAGTRTSQDGAPARANERPPRRLRVGPTREETKDG